MITFKVVFGQFEASVTVEKMSDNAKGEVFAVAEFLYELSRTWQQDTPQQQEESVTSELHTVEAVSVINDARGTSYRVHAGKYAKYGVPLYLDTCEMTESVKVWFSKIAKRPGRYSPPEPYAAQIMVVNGKPRRVTQLGEVEF